MADYGFRTHGKRCYYIGADYNAPQIIGKWTEFFSRDHGAEVLTKDFFPLDVAEFGTAIAKIQGRPSRTGSPPASWARRIPASTASGTRRAC